MYSLKRSLYWLPREWLLVQDTLNKLKPVFLLNYNIEPAPRALRPVRPDQQIRPK